MAWNTPFSKKEDQFIKRSYPAKSPSEIARHLGRSRSGVNGRIYALGLREKESVMRARVTDSADGQKRGFETLLRVARRGDEKETLEALRDILAERIDTTESARDIATLAKRLLEVGERITELGSKKPESKDARAEVTSFDVIAGRNAKRKKAAKA